MSIIIAPHTVHILYCRWNRAIIRRRNFFQSHKAGKRNGEWENTREKYKKNSNYHDYERRERQKYQRAWPKSLKVISTPRPEKCPLRLFNDCAGCGLSMRACNWNVTYSKKKTIFDLIIRGQVFDMIVQFCTGSICGWNLFQLLGLKVPVHLQKSKLAWYIKSLNC